MFDECFKKVTHFFQVLILVQTAYSCTKRIVLFYSISLKGIFGYLAAFISTLEIICPRHPANPSHIPPSMILRILLTSSRDQYSHHSSNFLSPFVTYSLSIQTSIYPRNFMFEFISALVYDIIC